MGTLSKTWISKNEEEYFLKPFHRERITWNYFQGALEHT
jgi:hypothetical protein